METKNDIIQNYARSLVEATNTVAITAANLNDNLDENNAYIKTLNVLIDSVRSQTVLLQQAIDNYMT